MLGSPVEIAKRQLTRSTHRIHSMPVVILMAHSRCNCRCAMCDIWRANRNGQELSRETIEAHLETFKRFRVRWVVLSGGEALMHSNLWALCEALKTLDIKITLLSSGLLLGRNAGEVVCWCDDVTVSLDGSREVHDRIRGVPRAFERLAAGISTLRELQPGYPVNARCVVQRENYADVPNIIDAAHEIGLDRISFLAVDVSSTAFNRAIPWGDGRVAEVALSRREVDEFSQVVEDTIISKAADFASGFVAESPEKLRRLPRYFAAINGHDDFPPTVCNAPWVSTVIETDGTVRPCFFHRALGNIYEQPLDAILNSPEAVAFRRDLDVNADPICRRCVCTLHLGLRTPVGP